MKSTDSKILDELTDLCLNQPYIEVNKDSVLFDRDPYISSCDTFAMPPPSKFKHPTQSSSRSIETTCCHGAVISLMKPHRILAVSSELLRTLGFASDQLCGRSISTLFGPRTDSTIITAAIKSTTQLITKQISAVLYTYAGLEVHVSGAILPFSGASTGTPGGCLLRIDRIDSADADGSHSVFLLDDLGFPGAGSSPSAKVADIWARQEANRKTGLDNEAERRRQRWGCTDCLPA